MLLALNGEYRPMSDFKVGDEAWIWLAHHKGELTQGTVIAELDLPGYSFRHYVIEIDTHVDPVLEIRAPGLGMFHSNIVPAEQPLTGNAGGD
jgi:hypothetical protein